MRSDYRFVRPTDGRGSALLRIGFGCRKSDSFGGTIPLAPFAATDRDGTFVVFTGGCTNVALAFAFSFAVEKDSGVSPRLKLLFELPDERLCKVKRKSLFPSSKFISMNSFRDRFPYIIRGKSS